MTPEEIVQIREMIAVASTGVEHGCVSGKSIAQHGLDFINSLGADTAVSADLHGVYLAGSETVVCHTGNGPHSEANARLITFALNNLGLIVNQFERLQREHGEWKNAAQELDRQRAAGWPTQETAPARRCNHAFYFLEIDGKPQSVKRCKVCQGEFIGSETDMFCGGYGCLSQHPR